tara:strand:- start:661 stop:1827 length:1167 start_codon:yes stop_codon:yes gene_type:complete
VYAALIFRWTGVLPVALPVILQSVKSCLLILVLPLLITGLQARAEECSTPQFGVNNVSIDQLADTASEARQLGTRAAAETAFAVVLERLLNDPEKISQFLDRHDLDQFSDFVHITEENSLEGRYIALLDFCFDADRLRASFRKDGLRWTELRSPPILVVPVWQGPDGARAWQSDNSWLSGWREAVETSNGLVNFVLLEPTIINERSLRAEDLARANPVTLSLATTLAEAEQTMLVIARLDYDGSSPVLTVDGQLFSSDGKLITTLAKMLDLPVSSDLVGQLAVARSQILQEMQASWYAANAISGNDTQKMTLILPINSLEEWASRLTVFDQIAVFNGYRVRKLDLTSGVVTVNVEGTIAAVKNALLAQGLSLVTTEDGNHSVIPLIGN